MLTCLLIRPATGCGVGPRGLDEPSGLPPADAVVVAPATFNTINKWAAGINDTYALGVLNEALGAGLPTVVSPYAKSALAAHPAFASSLERLKSAGAFVTGAEAIKPGGDGMPYRWSVIIDAVVSLRRA